MGSRSECSPEHGAVPPTGWHRCQHPNRGSPNRLHRNDLIEHNLPFLCHENPDADTTATAKVKTIFLNILSYCSLYIFLRVLRLRLSYIYISIVTPSPIPSHLHLLPLFLSSSPHVFVFSPFLFSLHIVSPLLSSLLVLPLLDSPRLFSLFFLRSLLSRSPPPRPLDGPPGQRLAGAPATGDLPSAVSA